MDEIQKAELAGQQEASESNGYEVLAVNMSWNASSTKTPKRGIELPTQMQLTIPEGVLKQASKPSNVFNDVLESYVYNTLSKKFKHELLHCQIWLPLDSSIQKA